MSERFARLKRNGRPDLSAQLMPGPRERRHALYDEQRKAELPIQRDWFRPRKVRREAGIRDY